MQRFVGFGLLVLTTLPFQAMASPIFHCQDERGRAIFSDRPCNDDATTITLDVPVMQGINYDTTAQQKQAVENTLEAQRLQQQAKKEAEQKKVEQARQAALAKAEQERIEALTKPIVIVRPTLGYGSKGWFGPDKRSHYYPIKRPQHQPSPNHGFAPYRVEQQQNNTIEYRPRPPLR